MPDSEPTSNNSCSLFSDSDRKFSAQPRRSGRRYGSGVKPALGESVTALKLQLSFLRPPLLLLHIVPGLQAPLLPLLRLSDGSITGAMLRELLKLSLSGCVSSNVRLEPSNLLTVQEKRGREEKVSPPPLPLPTQMMPTGSHRALNFAGRAPPPHPLVFCLMAPRLRFTDGAILVLSAWWGLSSCIQQKKQATNKEINKEISKHFVPSAEI